LALLLAFVSRRNVRQANVPMCGGHYSARAALCTTLVYAPLQFAFKFNQKLQWCIYVVEPTPSVRDLVLLIFPSIFKFNHYD
jgi:hypothetical protein